MSTFSIVDQPPMLRETTGGRLARLRKAKGWSQAHLADLAGLDRQTVRHAEQFGSDIYASTLEGLADALGVTMGFLWRGETVCRHDVTMEVTDDRRTRP